MPDSNVRSLYEPIRQATTVQSGRAHTFSVFTRRLADWWPVRSHSLGQEKVVSVHVEERLGGRVYEVWSDGQEHDWGQIITWDPPERFAMTWNTLSEVTEVEVHFRELGPALTRVELEHRGWERLPADEVALRTAPPNGYPYGWQKILARFTACAEGSNNLEP